MNKDKDNKDYLENNQNNDEQNNGEENQQDKIDSIKELGIPDTNQNTQRFQILPIIGQVEGHSVLPPQSKTTKYEHVIPQLVSIETNKSVEGVLIILNTVGGDVEAGLAIAEMIHSLSKPTVSLVIGGGHSIGVPLATSADYSFISPSATMIVHPIRMNGLVLGVPQAFEYFNKMQERIVEFICRTSNTKKETLRNLMLQTDELLNDMGTILIGKQAVDYGLINEVGGLSEAINHLEKMIDNKSKETS